MTLVMIAAAISAALAFGAVVLSGRLGDAGIVPARGK